MRWVRHSANIANIRDAVALESQRKVAGVALKMMFTSVNDMLIDEENTPRSLQETVDGMLTNVRLSVVEGMKGQSAAAALIRDHLAMRATGWLSPEAGLYHNLRCRILAPVVEKSNVVVFVLNWLDDVVDKFVKVVKQILNVCGNYEIHTVRTYTVRHYGASDNCLV